MSSPPVPPGLAGPRPATASLELPEPLSYRLKKRLLGPPLVSERLSEQRLGKPTALGVLAPDCISSTAYGSEEILTVLVPVVGAAAFALLLPITFAIIGVLFFVTLSYREVVMVYTRAGGAYVVARENFGVNVAQVAAVALIIDYIVTVAVQTAAGTDAVTSAFPALGPYNVPITICVVLLLLFGNLRGIREAGRTFALPTYLFVGGVGFVVVLGVVRSLLGQLHAHSIRLPGTYSLAAAHPAGGLLYGASLFVVMKSFANGGSSLTGLEAISNGVATFKPPEGRNARRVLVLMSMTLGTLVLGVSFLAWRTHAVPFTTGSPTVLSQEARYVFGSSLVAKVGYYFVQGATMLILYTGANTSFNGFPNLASFVAKDAYLPRQLTRRGHRLVFSNGIIILAVVSIALLLVTQARVNALVAVYAIGVFTGFTMAGAGMVRYHHSHRTPGWHRRIAINGFASLLSAVIVAILAVTKFTEGAWTVVVLFPVLVAVLIRLHRTYAEEERELEVNVQHAAEAPVLRRHEVLVFIERLDLASARALQYARSLSDDDPRAVHFVLDTAVARELEEQWTRLGLANVSLEIRECPDRRLTRAAAELVAELAGDGQTEVSVLLPRRVFGGPLSRVLHDRTSERISAVVSEIPNASATIIPFFVGSRGRALVRRVYDPERLAALAVAGTASRGADTRPAARHGDEADAAAVARAHEADIFPKGAPPGTSRIGDVRWRQRARVAGRVRYVRVQPRAGISSLEATLDDGTGQLVLVFQGRRLVPGVEPGARIVVEGMVGERNRRTAMINPAYTLLPGSGADDDSGVS
ncbi:MAG TPA: amino acid permease [Acidimicrobiales bacterium]|nr:amino acid permease [Acidimicrobiales bacterium]